METLNLPIDHFSSLEKMSVYSAKLLRIKMKYSFSRYEYGFVWSIPLLFVTSHDSLPVVRGNNEFMLTNGPKSLTFNSNTFSRDTQMNKNLSEN